MPLISNLNNKNKEKNKLFQKKSYRPWDHDLQINTITENIKNEEEPSFESNIKIESIINEEIKKNLSVLHNNPEMPCDLIKLNLEQELRKLYGAQKVVIQYLLKQIEEKHEKYVITMNVSMENFMLACKLPQNTIKGMLQKLKNKGLLESYENKPGRGGYARYKFKKEIYAFFSKNLNII